MLAALIAALVIGILASARRLAYDTDRVAAAIETRALAEAGLNRIIAAYANRGDPLRERLRSDNRPVAWEFAGKSIVLRVQAESGKLDLNAGDRSHIDRVLAALVPPSAHDRILRQIDEARAGDVRITSIASLLSPFERMASRRDELENHFTVMTGQRGVDPATAPILVLQTLPHLSSEQLERLIAVRQGDEELRWEIPAEARPMFVPERPIYSLRAEPISPKYAGAMRAIVSFDERGRALVYSWGMAASLETAR
jgi:hypothetical protein